MVTITNAIFWDVMLRMLVAGSLCLNYSPTLKIEAAFSSEADYTVSHIRRYIILGALQCCRSQGLPLSVSSAQTIL
jgi:hypothetical protein